MGTHLQAAGSVLLKSQKHCLHEGRREGSRNHGYQMYSEPSLPQKPDKAETMLSQIILKYAFPWLPDTGETMLCHGRAAI